MGMIIQAIRLKLWLILPLLAIISTGCILPGRTPATQTPTPTETATPEPTQIPATPTLIPTATATPNPNPVRQCAIEWEWRDEALIITEVDLSHSDGLFRNDKVILINGRETLSVILEEEAKITDESDPVKRRIKALNNILDHSMIVLYVQHKTESPYFYNLQPDCSDN
jgi:hypothetical protein